MFRRFLGCEMYIYLITLAVLPLDAYPKKRKMFPRDVHSSLALMSPTKTHANTHQQENRWTIRSMFTHWNIPHQHKKWITGISNDGNESYRHSAEWKKLDIWDGFIYMKWVSGKGKTNPWWCNLETSAGGRVKGEMVGKEHQGTFWNDGKKIYILF